MNIKKKLIIQATLLTLCLTQKIHTAASSIATPAVGDNTVFIFLDDGEKYLQAISIDLLIAVIQEAGPIIASAHLINNIRTPKTPAAHDNATLKSIIDEFAIKEEQDVTE